MALETSNRKVNNAENEKFRRWLTKAILRSLLVIFLVSIAVFFLIRLVPGDPAVMVLGEHASDQAIAELREKLNLNASAGEQFVLFLKNIVTRFDTGDSIKYGVSSRSLIVKQAPVTLLLVAMSLLLTLFFSIVLAFFAATHRDGIVDHLIRIVPAFTQGMPIFWIGLLLILLFSVRLGWFPVGGTGKGAWGLIRSLILPAITISFGQIPPLVRSLREKLLEVLDADFVVTLRAAQLSEGVIFRRHVLRNAFVPTLMLLSVNLSYLIGGTLVVEKVFAIRGIGKLLFEAISNRDFPLVQGVALYCAVFVVLISLVTDIIAHRIDPRMEDSDN